jgi:hypothetical protein
MKSSKIFKPLTSKKRKTGMKIMKNRDEEIMKEVEKTTVFFDRLRYPEPNPYFFTRLQARLDAPPVFRKAFRKAWVFALILANLISILVFWSDKTDSSATRESYLQEIASDLTISQSFTDPFEQTNE